MSCTAMRTVTVDCSSVKRQKRKSASKLFKKKKIKSPYVFLQRVDLGGNVSFAQHVSEENRSDESIEESKLVKYVSKSIDPDDEYVSERSNSGVGQISRKSTLKMPKKKRKTETKNPYVLLERVDIHDLGKNIPRTKHVSEDNYSDDIIEGSKLVESVSNPVHSDAENVSERNDLRIGHLPIQISRRLCVYCFYIGEKKRTQWQCMACDLALCCQSTGETCFQLYHSSNLKSSIERKIAMLDKKKVLDTSESDSSGDDLESEMTDSDIDHPLESNNSNGGHYPMKGVLKRKCVECKDDGKVKYTVWACEVCDVPLCMQEDGVTCFRLFHSAMFKSVEDSASDSREIAPADDSEDDSSC